MPAALGGAPDRRLLISAFGVHMGGGLVLLRALLAAAESRTREVLIDARIAASAADGPTRMRAVPRSFLSRIAALYSLARRARATDVLLCFNSLPPLVRSRAYVVNYVHAPHFVGAHIGIDYPRVTRLRLAIERFWFRRGVRYCDEIWVQTETMAQALLAKHPGCNVRVAPLVDEAIFAALNDAAEGAPTSDGSQLCFFYPADGVGHKNHARLLRAWQQLARSGLRPSLQLTLQLDELVRAEAEAGVAIADVPGIENLGRISREAVLARMGRCSALIFPSLAETFGLPLLEARMIGKPIVASERDFVRDVCRPRESFDPESPRSIARAVRRFVTGGDEMASHFYSAAQFVDEVLSCAS